MRRRFYSSYKSPVDNGVYAVKQDGRLIPLSKADYQCISVAIVHDDHKIMIEKNEDSNQSYKTATSGLPDSSTKTYSFYWGEYGTDQTGITMTKPYLPDDVSSWTNGALSDWDGKANSNVLKGVTTGGGSYTSYATAGHVLNTFLASADAKGYDDWYIPSCGQLSLIYMYLISVNNALLAIGGQPLDTRYYWSSSEHSSNSGWIVLFNNGRTFTRYKRLTSSVRFVRDIE